MSAALWIDLAGGRYFLLPEGVRLRPGALLLVGLGGQRQQVAESVATRWELSEAEAAEYLQQALLPLVARWQGEIEQALPFLARPSDIPPLDAAAYPDILAHLSQQLADWLAAVVGPEPAARARARQQLQPLHGLVRTLDPALPALLDTLPELLHRWYQESGERARADQLLAGLRQLAQAGQDPQAVERQLAHLATLLRELLAPDGESEAARLARYRTQARQAIQEARQGAPRFDFKALWREQEGKD